MNARSLINSLEFAKNGEQIQGTIPVAKLSRLLGTLDNPKGELSYTLTGRLDKHKYHWLELVVVGTCQLSCQRCLTALPYRIDLHATLLLCRERELDVEGDEEEPFDRILAEQSLNVLDLLEEEVLLSLPIAPRHEEGNCQLVGQDKLDSALTNPFAVLKDLKRN